MLEQASSLELVDTAVPVPVTTPEGEETPDLAGYPIDMIIDDIG